MPRDLKAHENARRMKARRDHALQRLDLRQPTTPREPAAGPVSHAVKTVDPDLRRMIDDAIARRKP